MNLSPQKADIKKHLFTLAGVAALLLASMVYLPGLSGPFVFDDWANIISNDYIKIHSLDSQSLYYAAYSLKSGPLHRPVAMASFALNHYFAGSFDSSAPYKLTNIFIHAVNGLLVFWLVFLIFTRAARLGFISERTKSSTWSMPQLLAALTALLWLVHPIQLTSVLYLVQRMTSLSATFVLLGVIAYLYGRNLMLKEKPIMGVSVIVLGSGIFGTIGILTKESAALLPFYMGAIEFVLYRNEAPWNRWKMLAPRTRVVVMAILGLAVLSIFVWALGYFSSGYLRRDFTMIQRLMTESRVLVLYISLILVPRLDQFGLQHDDLLISTSLLQPWTTLPSILIILGLFLFSIFARHRLPMISLGMLWFFSGHLMESTIIALEIVHEHRNYLPSLGVLLILTIGLHKIYHAYGARGAVTASTLFILLFASVTFLRAGQWSTNESLTYFEALHHPDSPRAQAGYGASLTAQKQFNQALIALRRAASLQPNEPGHMININIVMAMQGKIPETADKQETLKRLKTGRITALSEATLDYAVRCIRTSCSSLSRSLEDWARIIIERKRNTPIIAAYYYYILGQTLDVQGRVQEAIDALRIAYKKDPIYLHPLFEIANIYIRQGNKEGALNTVNEIKKANKNNPHPRNKEIDLILEQIGKMKADPDR